ncbi:MAG: hypothetical protein ACXWHZ_10590, partial [Usitatibacter sp.]
MKTKLLLAALVAACFSSPAPAGEKSDEGSEAAMTIAVFGDWPYNDLLLANSDLLVSSVNADR